MAELVCIKCQQPWSAPGSPARCPYCGQVSFGIAVQMGSQASAARKLWQDPEHRAKQSAAQKQLWQDPEYRAKHSTAISVGMKRRWQNPEFRSRLSAAHTDKHPTAETRAKISAALTRRHNKIGVRGND